jgi:hypothetical protein
MEPRIIEVMWDIRKQADVTNASLPVTLHVYHESRVEALKLYFLLSLGR